MNVIKTPRFQLIVCFILLGALSRLIPHPSNFTALTALGIFAGFYLKNYKQAMFTVLGAMIFSDFLIGFHSLSAVVYVALVIPILLGKYVSQHTLKAPSLILSVFASSLSFFIITNFAVWLSGMLYPQTWEGLIACYVAAIPFLKNQMCGDLFYSISLFSSFYLIQLKFPIYAKTY